MDKNNNTKVISALVLGTILGSALGIIFAPHKGSVTRRKLMGCKSTAQENEVKKLIEEANAFRTRAEELEACAKRKTDSLEKADEQNLKIIIKPS